MSRQSLSLWIGITVLLLVWAGPLPQRASAQFSAHMSMHVLVVALAAPLIACGLAGSRLDFARLGPSLASPLLVSALDLIVIWAFHAPRIHHASQHWPAVMVLEQGAFLLCGLAVWFSAFGGAPRIPGHRERIAAGVAGLLLTSMHMSLLGALLAVAPRPLYAHDLLCGPTASSALQDQELGGVLMLAAGGSSYLLGALLLLGRLLRRPVPVS